MLRSQGFLDVWQYFGVPVAACRLERRHLSFDVSLTDVQQPAWKIDMLPLQGVLFRRTQTRAERDRVELHPLRLRQDGQEREHLR